MTIWLVEDDPLQARAILRVLGEAFPDAELRHIKSELGFQKAIEVVNDPPALVVMDVMLPWTEIRLNAAGEPVVEEPPKPYNGMYRAGIRCTKLLREREQTRSVPVLLLTVLTEGDLADELKDMPPNVHYLSKREEPSAVVELAKKLIKHL